MNINQELLKYDFSMGWYSTGTAIFHEDTLEYLDGVDSDLAVLHNRCLANGVDCIVDFNSAGIPYIRGQRHIDLHSVFGKPMVQTAIFKNAYRTLKLDEVSKAVLGDGNIDAGGREGGKYKGLTGKDIQSLAVEEQKKYVLRDAELVMQLSKHNNGEVLDAMKSISEITGLDFEKVCRTGISTWWACIFENMVVNGECQASPGSFDKTEEYKKDYVGAIVLKPKKGLYHNLIVVDVTSLYPTMATLYNISFDTINCECCKDHSNCKINEEITKDCSIEKQYWICRQKEGAFPKRLKTFKEERIKQKNLGNQVKQLALKILINGGYGVFGSKYFKYYDPRVAELITAYGRYTLTKMQQIARNMGFEIVYGDTDSLFLYHRNENCESFKEELILRFTEECNRQLGVEVEHSKTYKTAIISDKKKHYVGWTDTQGKQSDIVGMEGEKNDRPRWINIVFRKMVTDIIIHNTDPIPNLKKAIYDLEIGNVNSELLKRSQKLSKNPEEYENENDRKRKIGSAVGARKGDVIEYFESDNKEGYSLNPQDISIKKYKVMLWKAVKDILEIAGYNIASIEQELIIDSKDGRTAEPPRGAAGYTSSIQQSKVVDLVNKSANQVM
jgi:DNA polymerase elongation subunit (family B)